MSGASQARWWSWEAESRLDLSALAIAVRAALITPSQYMRP